MYRLLLHPNIEKQLAKIPVVFAQRLANSMRSLQEEPRPSHSKHLIHDLYRLHEGDYRIVYAIFDDEKVVFIGKIGRRSEKIYRDLAAILASASKAKE